MSEQDFQPFGAQAGANVLTQADYIALPARLTGFNDGIAQPEQLNKVWRQSSVMASTIGQFIQDETGEDVLDNGDLAALLTQFKNAIAAATAAAAAGITDVVDTPQTVTATENATRYILNGDVTFTIAASTTLSTGFSVTLDTINGSATINVNAADHVNGGATLGGTVEVPKGREARITTDGAGNIYVSLTANIVSVPSSGTVDLGAQASDIMSITGITPITSFGSSAVIGQRFTLIAAAPFQITAGANLIIQGGTQICSVNDVMEVLSLGDGVFLVSYFPIGGQKQTVAGQCRLDLVSTNLVLSPYDGNKIVINGGLVTIPDAGVSLPPTGLIASTLYYIYAFLDGSGDLTLEASTTPYANLLGTGIMIKNGDQTRTLVGMAITTAATAWIDGLTNRGVKSWFNRKPTYAYNTPANISLSTSSSEFIATRTPFLAWTGESILAMWNGTANALNTPQIGTLIFVGIDGTAHQENQTLTAGGGTNSNSLYPSSAFYAVDGLSEGSHFTSVHGRTTQQTATYQNVHTVIWLSK